MSALYAATLFSTIFCTAVNAYTFQIAYPLWRHTPDPAFATLHRDYLRRLAWIITIPHIAMFFTSGALALLQRRPALIAVFVLNTSVILVSAFKAGPIHDRFTRNAHADEPGLTVLIRISAARTAMMLASSALLLLPLARSL